MKRFFVVFNVFLCVVAFCGCNGNKEKNTNNVFDKPLTEDSIGKWYVHHYSQFTFCITPNNRIEAKALNDSIVIAYMDFIYPKVCNAMNGVVDDMDSYRNISAYIGTDGSDWIVYDKFRSKVNGNNKIQYFKYDSTLPEKHQGTLCDESDFPDNWKDLISTIDNTPAPYPSELENNIFNKCTYEIEYTTDGIITFRNGKTYIYKNNTFQILN